MDHAFTNYSLSESDRRLAGEGLPISRTVMVVREQLHRFDACTDTYKDDRTVRRRQIPGG